MTFVLRKKRYNLECCSCQLVKAAAAAAVAAAAAAAAAAATTTADESSLFVGLPHVDENTMKLRSYKFTYNSTKTHNRNTKL